MATKEKVFEPRYDMIGREVKVGDYVAFQHHTELVVGKIDKFTSINISINPITKQRYRNISRNSLDCVKVENDKYITIYIMKKAPSTCL